MDKDVLAMVIIHYDRLENYKKNNPFFIMILFNFRKTLLTECFYVV